MKLLRRAAFLLPLASLAVAAVVTEGPPADALPDGAVARLGTTRFQQGGLVLAVAFSPDGKRLASAGEDAYVRVWDAATGGQVAESTRHYHGVHFVTYSNDGKRLATVSHGAVRLLDAATGEQRRILKLPTSSDAYLGPVYAAAFSPDGATLATGLDKSLIQLWDAETGAIGHRMKGHTDRVTALLYSPDGATVTSASDDGTVCVWDPAKGELVRTLPGEAGRVYALAATRDGKVLAWAGSEGAVRVWDAAAGREVVRIATKERGVYALAFSPDGKLLAGGSGSVRVWDAATGKEVRTMDGAGGGSVVSVAFSPDGKTLAAADATARVRLWDVATGRPATSDEGMATRVAALAFAPDGKTVVSGGDGEAPLRWDVTTGKVVRKYGDPGKFRGVAFSPDGRHLTAVTADRRVFRWDDAGKEVRQFHRENQGEPLAALSADGLTVAWGDLMRVAERNDWRRIVGVWDADAGQELAEAHSPEYQLYALALSPDGRTLLSSGSMDRSVGLYEAATGKRRDSWPGPEAGTSAATFGPDGRVVVTGGWDNQVWVRDAATGKILHRLPQAGTAHAVAVSPDGRLVASAGGGHRAVLVRDLATGKELRRFAGHRGDVWSIAFSTDGRLLASGGDDGIVLVWEVSAAGKVAGAPRLPEIPAGDLPALWTDLASDDAAKAFRAVWSLTKTPEAAAFLSDRLRPTAELDPARVKRLLEGLDDDEFAAREKAEEELASLGFLVEAALRRYREAPPSLESRMRLDRLLRRLTTKGLSVEEVRSLRAVEALERIGGPEARTALASLAKGAAESRITRDAMAALARLGRRAAP